jgi:hypothetical protein
VSIFLIKKMGHIMQSGMNTDEGANRRISRSIQRELGKGFLGVRGTDGRLPTPGTQMPLDGRIDLAENSTVASHIARNVGSTPTMPHNSYLASLPRNRRYAEIHRMKGLCIQCPRKAAPGRVRCVKCLAQMAAHDAKRYERRIAEGLCVHCGRAVEPGFTYHNRNECYPDRRLAR